MVCCQQKSSGARGGGSSSVGITDTVSLVIKLESMMFGQNRQPASEAHFFDKQLIITTKSDLTGMCLILIISATVGFRTLLLVLLLSYCCIVITMTVVFGAMVHLYCVIVQMLGLLGPRL